MSISAVNTNAAITAAQQAARRQAAIWNPSSSTTGSTPTQDSFTSDFASILASVQSGDINGAQAALAKLTGDQVPTDTSYSPTSTSGTNGSPTGAQGDVQSLLQAVQGGDITAAQKALTSLRSDMQADASSALSGGAPATGAAGQATVHHHHRHHHAAASQAPAPTQSTADSTTATTSTDSPFDLQTGSLAS